MIYCVEDDNGIRDLMLYTLKSSGIKARGFVDGAELSEALKTEIPELIMLDIMLPGEDGVSVLKKLRSNPATADIPVIFATAKGTEYNKVFGLDSGADDYLSKPFGMMEMMARIKAVLRRTSRKDKPDVLKIGDLEMNKPGHNAYVSGEKVILTLKEFELLEKFMESPGIVFTREQLLDSVWGTTYIGESRTVDVHIGTLRAKLGKCGEYIETVRGVGYRMEAQK